MGGLLELGIWLGSVLIYMVGWLATSLVCASMLAGRPRCHGSATYRSTCRSFHGEECWRSDSDRPTLEQSVYGCLLGLVWPFVLPAFGVYALGGRSRRVRLLTADQLARLEREAGIR